MANIVAGLGFFLLFVALILAVIVGIMFLFPQSSIGGMTAVNERDTQIVYRDEALAWGFDCGNFIIESTNCHVDVRMSTANSDKEGTIVVNESATGIAFNSLKRTLVEWTRTAVNGVPYFRIKVLEPYGVVVSDRPTTVYINLKSTTENHNFILRNQYSNVTFSYDDEKETTANALKIQSLVVDSAGKVTVPNYESLTVDTIDFRSNNTTLLCNAVVNNDVNVSGSHNNLTFNGAIGGDVLVKGNNNVCKGNTANDVLYDNAQGSITFNDIHKFTMQTVSAQASLRNVTAGIDMMSQSGGLNVNSVSGGIKMTTESGNLMVNNIIDGGLTFTVTSKAGDADVNVNQQLVGAVKIRNNGIGRIKLQGVDGDVDIVSSTANGGNIDVEFLGKNSHYVTIEGYDGDINVKNIYGLTNITVRDPGSTGAAGRANITARFKTVVAGDNKIITGAYVDSPSGIGNIDVYLLSTCGDFTLQIYKASSAYDYANGRNDRLAIGGDKNNIKGSATGSETGSLTVATPAHFTIRSDN